MEGSDVILEKGFHRRLAVGSFHALEDHPDPGFLDLFHSDKGKPAYHAVLGEKLVLQLPAHGHDLLEKLLDAVAVEIIIRQLCHRPDFFLLPGAVKHFFSCTDFIFCHLGADLHPFLEKAHDLLIDGVNLISQLQ